MSRKSRSRPAERRRQVARDRLRETSELAVALCSGAPDPVPSLAIDQSSRYISPPDTYVKKLEDLLHRVQDDMEFDCSLLQPPLHTYWIPTSHLRPETLQHGENCHHKYPLLIHWAAKLGNVSLYRRLIELDPVCLLAGNSTGQTALHIAIENGHSEWVRLCSTQFPRTCYQADRKGNLPLHHAAMQVSLHNSWVATPILANYPKGIRVPNQDGLYPMHLACLRAWNPGIKVMLAADYSLVDQRCDEQQWLPIDWALNSQEVLKEQIATKRGGAPTSIKAIATNAPEFSEFQEQQLLSLQLDFDECLEILLLTSYIGRAVLVRDAGDQFFPLHAIMRQPLAHWKYALQCFGKPRFLDLLDQYGRGPLHVLLEEGACYNIQDQVAIIQHIHALSSTSLVQCDEKGRIPLQIAILEGASAEVIEVLVGCGGVSTAGMRWNDPAALVSTT